MRRDVSVDSCTSTEAVSPVTTDKNLSPNTIVMTLPNRFYVMDWLEQLDEMAMEQAKAVIKSNNLQTPLKKKGNSNNDSQRTRPATPPRRSDHLEIQRNMMVSPHRRRSEAIGNGWNAKGLQKAKIGEWEQALACWENALEIRLQILGENHPDVSNTLNNMGIALGRLERCDEAMTILNRALKIRTMLHGSNVHHSEIAATLHNIGNIFQQMKDYDGALRCFTETKRTQLVLLGEKDLLVARTENAIGHLHFEYNHFERALESYTTARDIFQKAGLSKGNGEYDSVLLDIQDAQEAIGTRC